MSQHADQVLEVIANHGTDNAIGMLQVSKELELSRKGVSVTNELRESIRLESIAEVDRICVTYRKQTLSAPLNELLDAKNKREAEKAAGKLILDQDELFRFITVAELCGFIHRQKHLEFIPPAIGPIDFSKFGDADPATGKLTRDGQKASNQIAEVIKKRRQLNVHWFERESNWHCFYFDFGDLLKGHWEHGDHIHYLSHHWGMLGDRVWSQFDDQGYSPSRVHIRYKHNLRRNRSEPLS